MANEFCLKMPDFHVTLRDILHAVNLRHGTNGFTSIPKEGLLRIFSPWKIRRLRPGLNPRTWVPKASTLPLDHWSCLLMGSEYTLRDRNYHYMNTSIVWTRLYLTWYVRIAVLQCSFDYHDIKRFDIISYYFIIYLILVMGSKKMLFMCVCKIVKSYY